jgi:hypothetical protein
MLWIGLKNRAYCKFILTWLRHPFHPARYPEVLVKRLLISLRHPFETPGRLLWATTRYLEFVISVGEIHRDTFWFGQMQPCQGSKKRFMLPSEKLTERPQFETLFETPGVRVESAFCWYL